MAHHKISWMNWKCPYIVGHASLSPSFPITFPSLLLWYCYHCCLHWLVLDSRDVAATTGACPGCLRMLWMSKMAHRAFVRLYNWNAMKAMQECLVWYHCCNMQILKTNWKTWYSSNIFDALRQTLRYMPEQCHALVASRSHAKSMKNWLQKKRAFRFMRSLRSTSTLLSVAVVAAALVALPRPDIKSWRLITVMDVALDLCECILTEEVDVYHQSVLITFLGILTQCQ